MNYYILNNTIFKQLDKSQIHFALSSIVGGKWIVTTPEKTNQYIASFESAEGLSEFTYDYPGDWVGDNSGVSLEDLNETEYLNGI